ncbi:MAG: thioredoxin domain-containing protein [Patescibacteria group bacterium]
MNKNTVLIAVVSIFGTFLLLFGVYKLVNQPTQTDFPQTKQIKAEDHIKWRTDKDSKNILVEYSDFQCPSCKNVHDIFKTIEASNSPDFGITKNITFIFRYFPLYQIHDKAYLSAYAAEAAGIQGKFWEMSDLLFTNQTAWSTSNDPLKEYFLGYAKQLQLNVDQFSKDINSGKVKDRINQDLLEAGQIGIDSTPTFFLNGKKVDVSSFDELKTLLKSI